ncbi:hypothetical protein GCM10011380_29550 [Sphingomonas metalli]|uniref:Uncharacterized protein n=1 Tax=Sphingomonas metalli TaxID=1779358 RepID=A0A916TCH4_9SPHN|nr:hypothetical protein [Sphingomonas metalli]GGB38243.1 hypothetical protein GCM10011380_29550 [Sphingomonas metalli]
MLFPAGATAQRAPVIDTEDAGLGGTAVGAGRFHPIIGLDLRNGDFARGGYDDDAANLDRVPVHAQLGFAWELGRDRAGKADFWLVGTSSNGLHAPVAAEWARPRGWYESNNLVGLVVAPGGGWRLGAAYTIKASPNGVSATTHEASLTAALDGERGLAALHPAAAVTTRTRGDGGVYAQASIQPELALGHGEDAPSLSVPLLVGTGWGGFYGPGTGTVAYASAGLAYAHPFTAGGAHWRLRAEVLALLRDATLRRLGSEDAETAAVVPLATVGVTMAF